MFDTSTFRSAMSNAAVSLALICGTVAAAVVETSAQVQSRSSDAQLLEDFAHYVMIANTEMARATAQALLNRNLEPSAFLGLIEDSLTMQERFERAYRRAILSPELEGVASQLQSLYEEGRRARARDPREIERNIGLLTGMARGRLLAQQRLMQAGEYAAPQLLDVLLDQRDPLLQAEVAALLGVMGRQSLQPLCEALLHVDPATQETLARILGRIGYPSAIPYLTELHRTTPHVAVQAATGKAIASLGGSVASDVSVAALYRDLAEAYYAEPRGLTAFPGESHQLLWDFVPALGLQPTAIRTEVYHEAMTMRLAERALRLDPADQGAVSLWLAANLKREIDQPEGYDNPAYPPTRRGAMYYAVAAGAEATQSVLARALASHDTRLARLAIEALSRSAGVSGLVGSGGVPLAESLSYPDRRVRFEAALALGRARPTEAFEGFEQVVPTLAGVIREARKRYAVVLAADAVRQQQLRSLLEREGFDVLPPGRSLAAVADSIAERPGIDLIATDLSAEATVETISEARRSARLRATPVLATLTAAGVLQYAQQYEDDRLTLLLRQGITDEQMVEGLRQLVERASGPPVSEEEARAYAMAALNVLHDLAIAGGPAGSLGSVLDVADAVAPLISALAETQGAVRMQVADVLSYIGQQRAQVSLMDAAMASSGSERLALLSKVVNSAKQFGNLLEDRQVRWLLRLAEEAGTEEATLSASLMGALNLPNVRVATMILGTHDRR